MSAAVQPSWISVEDAAATLGVAPRTVRRWCASGRLPGQRVGTVWVVLASEENQTASHGKKTKPGALHSAQSIHAIRTRLRATGQLLIDVGNRITGAQRRPGKLFLTWQSQRGLQVTLAIGRVSPLHGWAPQALGALPFWMQERDRWRPVMPLVKRYETLRAWCAPQLLRIAGVGEVVLAGIAQLERAILAMEAGETGTSSTKP